jgi:hypothetical protein
MDELAEATVKSIAEEEKRLEEGQKAIAEAAAAAEKKAALKKMSAKERMALRMAQRRAEKEQ